MQSGLRTQASVISRAGDPGQETRAWTLDMILGLSPRSLGLSFHTDQERGSVLVIQAPRGSESVNKHGLLPTWLPPGKRPHLGSRG